MGKTEELLGELNESFSALAGQVIEQKINEKINSLIIGKQNLSPELKKLIMEVKTTSGASGVPAPPTQSGLPTPKSSSVAIQWDEITKSIIADILAGNNVYLWGVAGTGKTVLAENIATYLGEGDGSQGGSGAGKRTINCSQWTSPTEIRGGQTITGYKQGTMIEAWENGDILILDELPKLDPNTAGLLNDVLSKTSDMPKKDSNGNIILSTWTYTTDGAGRKVYKGGYNPSKASELLKSDKESYEKYINECYNKAKRFAVIGTGNTDMKTLSTKFGGNNRQDYSLVDRFSGAFYNITFEYTEKYEIGITFSKVREIMYQIREFLASQQDIMESVSARTVLNVNRIYLQEMLINIKSPLALKINNKVAPEPYKTFEKSVLNFLDTLPEQLRVDFYEKNPYFLTNLKNATDNAEIFTEEFKRMYMIDPFTGNKA